MMYGPERLTARILEGELTHPRVYEPEGDTFGASVPWDRLLDAHPSLAEMSKPFSLEQDDEGRYWVRCSSWERPEVVPRWLDPVNADEPAVDALVRELARLDARNVLRDEVFRYRPTDVEVSVVEGKRPGTGWTGRRLVLHGVTVYL